MKRKLSILKVFFWNDQGPRFFDSGFFQQIKTGGWFSDSEIMKESEPTHGSLKIQITLQHRRRRRALLPGKFCIHWAIIVILPHVRIKISKILNNQQQLIICDACFWAPNYQHIICCLLTTCTCYIIYDQQVILKVILSHNGLSTNPKISHLFFFLLEGNWVYSLYQCCLVIWIFKKEPLVLDF